MKRKNVAETDNRNTPATVAETEIKNKQQENKNIIRDAISQLDTSLQDYDNVSKLLPQMLEEGEIQLDTSVYSSANSEPSGVGRYLIYEHPDKEYSIWFFAFSKKQKTSIHDHQYTGTVTILNGPLTEKTYEIVDDSTEVKTACIKHRADRHRFHRTEDVVQENKEDKFVHQLKYRKGSEQISSDGSNEMLEVRLSMHIYKMPATMLNAEGEVVDRRNFNKIYTKVKCGGQTMGAYAQFFSDKANMNKRRREEEQLPTNSDLSTSLNATF